MPGYSHEVLDLFRLFPICSDRIAGGLDCPWISGLPLLCPCGIPPPLSLSPYRLFLSSFRAFLLPLLTAMSALLVVCFSAGDLRKYLWRRTEWSVRVAGPPGLAGHPVSLWCGMLGPVL